MVNRTTQVKSASGKVKAKTFKQIVAATANKPARAKPAKKF